MDNILLALVILSLVIGIFALVYAIVYSSDSTTNVTVTSSPNPFSTITPIPISPVVKLTGTFTPLSPFQPSEFLVQQIGDFVFVDIKGVVPFEVGSTDYPLGSISGVPIPKNFISGLAIVTRTGSLPIGGPAAIIYEQNDGLISLPDVAEQLILTAPLPVRLSYMYSVYE